MRGERTRTDVQGTTNRSAFGIVGQWATAAAIGAIILPRTLGDPASGGISPNSLGTEIWLVGALLVTLWIALLTPPLSAIVRAALASVPWDTPSSRPHLERFRPGICATVVVAIIDVALGEAVLRPPIRAIVAGSSASVDALVAVTFLVIAVLLFLRLQFTSSPLLEAAAWCALDALVPTTGSGTAPEFAATGEHRTRAAVTSRRSTIEPTEYQDATHHAAPAPTVLETTRTAVDTAETIALPHDGTQPAPKTIDDTDATLLGRTELAPSDDR